MSDAVAYQLDALRQEGEDASSLDVRLNKLGRGPDAPSKSKPETNYLLLANYRTTSLPELLQMSDEAALAYLAKLRWGHLGEGVQVCPACGTIDKHIWCPTPKRWKCSNKLCGKQFTVLQGTRLHGLKKPLQTILGIALAFVESKDSCSARNLSGTFDLAYHTSYVLAMKMREAIADTMKAEPKLSGYIVADAAYFMKYLRPANVGTGASLAAKRDQKNAGLDENGKTKRTVSEKMKALVVFVQTGQQKERRYKVAVVETENQVQLLDLAKDFCERDALVTTDGHSAYNFFSGVFTQHHVVEHEREFMTEDGHHTNMAENFFSRMRSAEKGSWHKMTFGHIEEYGWEFAWRQTMVGYSNREQLEDLLIRLLRSGRSERYRDYWGKGETPSERVREEGDDALAVEVPKSEVKAPRGRPKKGSIRPPAPSGPKRNYTRRAGTASAPQDAQEPAGEGPGGGS